MRFGIREICNVVFKATTDRKIGSKPFKAGQPVIYFDSLKTSTMEQATTTVYAQGGRGNTRLVAWEGEKTLTFTMEDALISEMGLAILAGANLYKAGDTASGTEADTLLVHVTESIVCSTDKNLVLSKKVADKDNVPSYALKLNDAGEIDGEAIELTVSTTTQDRKTVTADTVVKDTVYLVDYYTEVANHATQIDIEPQCFGGNFYIEADTLFRDTLGADHAAQFIIPNGKIQSNFTLSMASSGDPSTFTFTVDAFPGYVNGDKTKKVMASIQIIEEDNDPTDTVNTNDFVNSNVGANDPAGDKTDAKWTAKSTTNA